MGRISPAEPLRIAIEAQARGEPPPFYPAPTEPRAMAGGLSEPVIAAVALWIIVGLGCLPLLGSVRIRAAFEDWPTDRVGVNYLVITGLLVLGQALVFFGGVVVTGGFKGTALVRWAVLVAGAYAPAVWLLLGLAASATGFGPSRGDDGYQWAALGLGALWYGVVTVVATAVVFFVLFALFFPG